MFQNPNRKALSAYSQRNSRPYGGRDVGDDQFASKVFGDIARKDWQDYKSTFVPVHGLFSDAVMSDELTNQQVERVSGNIEQQFAQVQGQADARNARMGLASVEPANTSSSQGLATVFAENQARSHGKERRMSAIAGANITPQDTRVNQ